MKQKILLLLTIFFTTLTIFLLLTNLFTSEENNIIHYTSNNEEIVTPYKTDVFGANIVSNTYENGQGKIVFDGDITKIGVFAFNGCESLTSIKIPNSVTTFGEGCVLSLLPEICGNSQLCYFNR